MPDWRSLFERWDEVDEALKEKIIGTFKAKPREKLEEFFRREPYAQKLYRKLFPPAVPPEVVEVHMKLDVPARSIRGVTYGPYKASSVYKVPRWLADEFISRRVAERYVAPPKVPPPKKPPPVEYGITDADRRELRAELMSEVARVAPAGTTASQIERWVKILFPSYFEEWKTAFKDMPREEAWKRVKAAIKGAAGDVADRIIPRRVPRPPVARLPPVVPEVVTPPTARVPMVGVPARIPEKVERICPISGRKFTWDYNLEKIVRVTELLNLPAMWYELHPDEKEKWNNLGYRDIYDALAYRLVAGRATGWRKTGRKGLRVLTVTELRDAGLNADDIKQIEMRAAVRWLPPPEKEYPKGQLECHAYVDEEEVKVPVEITLHSARLDLGVHVTPFTLTLDKASYYLRARYNKIMRADVAVIQEGKTIVKKFRF